MIRFLLLTLCLLLSLALNAVAQDSDQPTGTISVTDSAAQDAAIATRIRDILGELEGYEDVTVTVSSGIVTLRGTTLDAASASDLNDLTARVEGVVAIRNQVSETTDVSRRLDPAIERFEKRLSDLIAWAPLLLIALAAFLIVVFLGLVIARMKQPWDRLAPNAFIADIYRQLIRLAFVIAGIVVGLDILNATALLSTILGAAGIIGLAIGFAVRDTVENFIASVMLSVRQPFRPNDAVEINGDEGKVIRLTSRATILLSYDGNHIRIPNATVFKSRIVNYSMNDERRFVFDLGIAPDADMVLATQVARDTLAALPFTLQSPAPNAWIDSVGDSTVALRIAGWIDQRVTSLQAARGEAIRLCMAALSEAAIAMPEPTYRILDANPPAAQDDAPPAPAKPAPAKPAAAPASAPPAPDQVMDVQATQDQELEAIVDEERREKRDDDLLTRDAPTE
ncbi:mechanosensitive ion channel domain-containing protein [Pseudooceanicola nitratireducens]|uniref:mechanosensitive ion channel domain-containing protein n=1 Tax=Pseudooceanicola nitratireducens TaxID=517719 RepID=UPI001C962143|nr:mechanosensitive ion channel domain-containing protein [Pseudooceanicola nitratireducens]MBY6158413.1 mechanosensitive ion channel [Pseudooceanicola nitratireducens]